MAPLEACAEGKTRLLNTLPSTLSPGPGSLSPGVGLLEKPFTPGCSAPQSPYNPGYRWAGKSSRGRDGALILTRHGLARSGYPLLKQLVSGRCTPFLNRLQDRRPGRFAPVGLQICSRAHFRITRVEIPQAIMPAAASRHRADMALHRPRACFQRARDHLQVSVPVAARMHFRHPDLCSASECRGPATRNSPNRPRKHQNCAPEEASGPCHLPGSSGAVSRDGEDTRKRQWAKQNGNTNLFNGRSMYSGQRRIPSNSAHTMLST
jgi:hypothetical protein